MFFFSLLSPMLSIGSTAAVELQRLYCWPLVGVRPLLEASGEITPWKCSRKEFECLKKRGRVLKRPSGFQKFGLALSRHHSFALTDPSGDGRREPDESRICIHLSPRNNSFWHETANNKESSEQKELKTALLQHQKNNCWQ